MMRIDFLLVQPQTFIRMHFIADFLIKRVLSELGGLTITTEQNATILAKNTKPRRRIALQRGSLMC